ncbi:conserved hypothetical protein [Nitrosopumilaceae archaeon]|nr:conserved hypothetical protein [Nitrosopumilaceae archaeon]
MEFWDDAAAYAVSSGDARFRSEVAYLIAALDRSG